MDGAGGAGGAGGADSADSDGANQVAERLGAHREKQRQWAEAAAKRAAAPKKATAKKKD